MKIRSLKEMHATAVKLGRSYFICTIFTPKSSADHPNIYFINEKDIAEKYITIWKYPHVVFSSNFFRFSIL